MKLFKKLTALLLVLAMMFAFAACNKSDDDSKSKADDDSKDVGTQNESSEENKSKDEKSKEDDSDSIVGEWEGTFDMSTTVSAMLTARFEFEVEVEFIIGVTLELDDNGEYTMSYDADGAVEAAEQLVKDVYDIYKDNVEDPEDFETFTADLDYEELAASLVSSEQSGEYEFDGDKLYLDGDTENYLELDGDTLTWEVEDMFSMEFERA